MLLASYITSYETYFLNKTWMTTCINSRCKKSGRQTDKLKLWHKYITIYITQCCIRENFKLILKLLKELSWKLWNQYLNTNTPKLRTNRPTNPNYKKALLLKSRRTKFWKVLTLNVINRNIIVKLNPTHRRLTFLFILYYQWVILSI